MGVLLQAEYRLNAGVSVPCPEDGTTPDVPWFDDHIAQQAESFAASGFTALLHMPDLKTSDGCAPGADGYGPCDDYDIGSKDQCGSIPTRSGTRQQKQRKYARVKRFGMSNYSNIVNHQRMGYPGSKYEYPSATGKTNGRFPKNPQCFTMLTPTGAVVPGFVGEDPIAGPVIYDEGVYAFGNKLATVTSRPVGYVLDQLVASGDWLTRTLGSDGYRDDDVKGQVTASVRTWAHSLAMATKILIGEYVDAPQVLNDWCNATGRYAFDFPLQGNIKNMCNNNSRWDMTQLVGQGFAAVNNSAAVTFVENHDTDTDGFESVIWNKEMGYALIMAYVGYPCVYYRDYSSDPGCYGLHRYIDNQIWCHEHLAIGDLIWRQAEYQFIAFERDGNLLFTLNNDQYSWQTASGVSNFREGTRMHDYSGYNTEDFYIGPGGSWVTGIPPNVNGKGYGFWAPAGKDGPTTTVPQTDAITQTFFGAVDLDIGPAVNGVYTIPFQIFCKAGQPITMTLTADRTGWQENSGIEMQARAVASGDPTGGGFLDVTGTVKWQSTTEDGWHEFTLTGHQLPATGSHFELVVTYVAGDM
jgi:alpha-amylase